ncbi:GntR family transcriptional regulator [Chthoniobacter flavus]|uniref:GntR family transcriptional regulator n=1 Tax=Chthoniobacter flavus TaxID=191863 RepID=UPI00105183C7|nr:GntR family transcriptional regulator [Chthoniobacter flavus]TCO95400.1 GntR family transcriptional regulator [Chthoniobacter flavus]
MSLGISIAPASDIPIFRQIVQQVQQAVALGRLQVGDQLPAIRVLAETLVINPNTVARAYQDMIRDGVLESRSGRGVFVSQKRQVFADAERERRLRLATEQLCHEAILLDFDLSQIHATLDETWSGLRKAVAAKSPDAKGAHS